jgi:hypothetical protein
LDTTNTADAAATGLGATAGPAASGPITAAGSAVGGAPANLGAAAPDLIGGGFSKAAPSVLDKIGSALTGSYAKIGGEAISALGLGKSLMTANQPNPIRDMSQVENLAKTSVTQGQTLQQYLVNGTLPPAIQASVTRATQDAITTIKSKYASMGIAPGSTQELAEIANLQQEAVIKGATLADQLYQQGVSQTDIGAKLYTELVGANTTLNNQTNAAIGNLASALAGGGRVVTQSGTQAA